MVECLLEPGCDPCQWRPSFPHTRPVIPAHAGIHMMANWTPACAGVTRRSGAREFLGCLQMAACRAQVSQ